MVLVMRVYRLASLLSLLSLLLLVTGCGSPFPPRTLVERLRVLGIRSEPADAIVNLTTLSIDSPLKFSALVADPILGRTYIPTWGVCLTVISDTASTIDCPGANSLALPSGQCTFQLPSGECTTQLSQSDFISWLTAPQQGLDPATIDPTLTQVDIWIGFLVSAQDESGAQVDEVRAVKRLPVHLYRADSKPLESTFNHNPVLNGLNTVTDNTIGLTLGQKIRLKPYIDPDSRETFTPSGETARKEDFVYTWFSTIGEFDYAHTISAWDNQDNKLDENVWAIPETLTDDQKADTTLWLVMRDGRFGTDWKVFTGQF